MTILDIIRNTYRHKLFQEIASMMDITAERILIVNFPRDFQRTLMGMGFSNIYVNGSETIPIYRRFDPQVRYDVIVLNPDRKNPFRDIKEYYPLLRSDGSIIVLFPEHYLRSKYLSDIIRPFKTHGLSKIIIYRGILIAKYTPGTHQNIVVYDSEGMKTYTTKEFIMNIKLPSYPFIEMNYLVHEIVTGPSTGCLRCYMLTKSELNKIPLDERSAFVKYFVSSSTLNMFYAEAIPLIFINDDRRLITAPHIHKILKERFEKYGLRGGFRWKAPKNVGRLELLYADNPLRLFIGLTRSNGARKIVAGVHDGGAFGLNSVLTVIPRAGYAYYLNAVLNSEYISKLYGVRVKTLSKSYIAVTPIPTFEKEVFEELWRLGREAYTERDRILTIKREIDNLIGDAVYNDRFVTREEFEKYG